MKAAELKYTLKPGTGATLLLLLLSERRSYCYWCGQKLNACATCGGKGMYNQHSCERCNGTGALCLKHDKLWD
jgi:hypothetical protein